MTQAQRSIRCSRLDDAFECQASVLSDKAGVARVQAKNPEAAIGKAIHAVMAEVISGEKPDVAAISEANGVDTASTDMESVAAGVEAAMKSWSEIRKYFQFPMVERSVRASVDEHWELTGTVDVLSPVGTNGAVFVDWKTGRIQGHVHQMAGYAYCIWQTMGCPDDAVINGIVVYTTHRYYKVIRWDAAKLRAWRDDLVRNVLSRPDTYTPNQSCHLCELYYSCDARKQMVEGTLDAMLFGGTAKGDAEFSKWLTAAKALLMNITAESKDDPVVVDAIVKLTTRVKMAEEACSDVRSLIRDAVDRVGPIKASETTSLALRQVNRESLDPKISLPVLREHMSESDIQSCMTLSLSKAMAIVGKGVPQASKAHKKGSLYKALKDAEAIIVTPSTRLEEVDTSSIAKEQTNG